MSPADRYAALLPGPAAAGSRLLREQLALPRAVGEIELQARWFSGEFGRDFTTADGRAVRIVQFGVWNREAGPDFAEAAVAFDGAKPLRGAIELDLDARDWERHGHATNPAYENVILHLWFQAGQAAAFSRTPSHRAVPQVRLDPAALIPGLAPAGDAPAILGRCAAPLQGMDDAKLRSVLESAAQYRLRRKAARLAALREARGDDEALFQALAETLGYKGNELAFALLTQRAPLAALRRCGAPDALLYGLAGFLKPADFPAAATETKAYLRALWEQWWTMRGEWERLQVPANLWRAGGQRPANHPQRRLAALAALVRHWSRVRAAAAEGAPAQVQQLMENLRDSYWDHHYTVTSGRLHAPMALAGSSRVRAMLANVFYPWWLLNQPEHAAPWDLYRKLPADAPNRRVEIAASRLFGSDERRKPLLKQMAMQQGLLQIYEDFCARDASDCAACPFPRHLAEW